MKYNWKKYLIVTGIISIILALFIPETILYLERINDVPVETPTGRIEINIYGLLKILFYDTLFWFCISFCSLSFIGFILLIFKKQNAELK